jgi:SAM-dependent methyltransferase
MADERDDDALEAAKLGRHWRDVAAVDAAYARGELDDAGWHRAMAGLIVDKYLAAPDERGGSGHTGTAEDWEYSRGIVAESLDRAGSFLDVGCANGLLMESMARWGMARGLAIEPYGLEIAPELAARARERLPHWAERIFTGNALSFRPARRFDYVRTTLEYAPGARGRELVAGLLEHAVAPGGRLVLGKMNETREHHELEDQLRAWRFAIAGRAERPHRKDPRLVYRVVWIDAR